MKNLVKEMFFKYGYDLTERQVEQFCLYYDFLMEENKKYNLTAITEPKDVVLKHFIDSVIGEKFIRNGASIIDVGTGAGFPGVPLKIVRQDIKLTLLDSLQKRINFLNELLRQLGINDVITVHERSEDYCQKHREMFDVALSRAVAPMVTLSEYLLPFVKVGGKVLMYKGAKLEEELSESKNAIEILGGKAKTCHSFKLEEIDSERFILEIDKVKRTDKKYPRGKNLPRVKPLK